MKAIADAAQHRQDLGLILHLVILVATFIVGNPLGNIVSRLGRNIPWASRRCLPVACWLPDSGSCR